MAKKGHFGLTYIQVTKTIYKWNLIISHKKRPPIVWSIFIKPKRQLWYKSRIVTVNVKYSMILYYCIHIDHFHEQGSRIYVSRSIVSEIEWVSHLFMSYFFFCKAMYIETSCSISCHSVKLNAVF